MPRRDAFEADSGDSGLVAQPDRYHGGGNGGAATATGGAGGTMNPPIGSATASMSMLAATAAAAASSSRQSEDPELRELERRLNEEVDEEFFEEPRKFSTLQRVLDVLGFQMDDVTLSISSGGGAAAGGGAAGLDMIAKNPAYRQLKSQQEIVEGAIEHMAVIHCADLNGSVIQVGRVARQFSDAVHKVRVLRKQVRDIQDGLGGSGGAASSNPNEPRNTGGAPAGAGVSVSRPQNAAAMSLRELWLKKLECEATLSLLDKLDVVRAAPAKFDAHLQPPYVRIGAAVVVLSDALSTMFSDDIAQVGALHKIMEQLMLRKQRAEEIVWETISDVVYLRTGNAFLHRRKSRANRYLSGGRGGAMTGSSAPSSSHSVSSESRRSLSRNATGSTSRQTTSGSKSEGGSVSTMDGMVNPFVGLTKRRRFALDSDLEERSEDVTTEDSDEDDDDDEQSGASLFSLEEDGDSDEIRPLESGISTEPSSNLRKATLSSSKSVGSMPSTTERAGHPHRIGGAAASVRMMIPIPILEAELDLEEDERRCLEEVALSRGVGVSSSARTHNLVSRGHHHGASGGNRAVPRYLNPVLASKILIECLFLLKRLDDVERVLGEGLEREIRRIVQREQARTFARLERLKRNQVMTISAQLNEANLREFRQHLTGLLSAFGSVMIRLSHLTEILRFRIGMDKSLLQKFGSSSSVMRSVLSHAYDIMQREIKSFLKACLVPSESSRDAVMDTSTQGSRAYEKNLFSLGIVDRPGTQTMSTATRTNVMEMSTSKFVVNILCAKTKVTPQIRHALTFRRSVARWTHENESMKKELAVLTGEDTAAPSFNTSNEERAIFYLDKVIQKELLPALQEEAVNGTVKGLEHRDAFDPALDRTLYSRPGSNDPHDVDMCKACQAMYDSTSPLFLALHRLPPGGEMYTPLVAVLEHVMLTFISRVKQQVGKVCSKKTASTLLEEEEKPGTLSWIAEKRRPFAQLLRAYSDLDALDLAAGDHSKLMSTGLMPLSPPSTDTAPRKNAASELKQDMATLEDFSDGVEGEQLILQQELGLLYKLLDFDGSEQGPNVGVCSDEELMKAACLAHSLLKLASLLGSRLKVRSDAGERSKALTSTRTLQEAIKTIQKSGMKMAKFCRIDMMLQALKRMAKVPTSSTLVARDAVRIPSSVNDLGEYLTSASDNLREASGNAVTAYTFSSLEQYIPHFLMRVVRLVAQGKGVIAKAPLTMNGIESLDRSGSVLYRDLKGATSFDNSFWDVELAAISFERSASFIAMMELEMEELHAYYTANREDFPEDDFILMFSMTGPRRRGDVGQYHMLKRRLK